MYAAIYGYDKSAGFREHLGNVLNIEYNVFEKTFDFGYATIKGSIQNDISKSLLYVINSESGRNMFAGFVKNIKPEPNTTIISFKGDDFRKIFDTSIVLDFTQESLPSHTVKALFNMVCNQIAAVDDPFISALPIQFIIPEDLSDTKIIADYTGTYMVVNAANFLKVYLSWYGYWIKSSYSEVNDSLVFEFKKAPVLPIEIKLKDFVHEKTSSDIKTNKVIATIKFEILSEEAVWEDSVIDYYNANPDNRAVMVGNIPPDPSGYVPGFALKLIEAFTFISADLNDYQTSNNQYNKMISWNDPNPPLAPPTSQEAIEASGNPNSYGENAVLKVLWYDVNNGIIYTQYPTYIKTSILSVSYFKLSDYTFSPRPNLPQRIYTLGKDNNIYSGYAPDSLRIFPIVTKIFESTYLSEAQVNAVFEIVNNRFVENILITSDTLATPINLSTLDLYTTIRVFDDIGEYKEIPISEKSTTHSSEKSDCEIKLGFKKTLLTEIIKNDIGTEKVVKQSGGGSAGSNIIKEELPVWEGETTPDTTIYKTWFRPVNLGE